jgi:protein-disulfide isomerase
MRELLICLFWLVSLGVSGCVPSEERSCQVGAVNKSAVILQSGPAVDDADDIQTLRKDISKLQEGLRALRSDLQKATAAFNTAAAQMQPAKPKTAREPDTTIYNVEIGSSPTIGPKDAPVTIVEFADFQCPYCAREYPKIKKILEEYPDKVRFVFKHYPLNMHKKAKPVHAATELARLEGGTETFWKMHDMIMANPKQLEITNLRVYAESLGLNLTKFDEVMADEKKIDELLKADMSEAGKCNVRGTPTVLINGLRLSGRNIEDYKARIDKILSENTKK